MNPDISFQLNKYKNTHFKLFLTFKISFKAINHKKIVQKIIRKFTGLPLTLDLFGIPLNND